MMNPDAKYTYNWKHLPTGKEGTSTRTGAQFLAEGFASVEAALCRWNGIAPGVWQYWR